MTPLSRVTHISLAAVALAFASEISFAQSNSPAPEVQITAFKPVMTTGTNAAGRRVNMVQLSHRVSYADLDIATHSGATELQKRIKDAATAVCQQLQREYPSSSQADLPSGSCVNEAIKSATPQANAAIAAAEKATVHSAQAPQ